MTENLDALRNIAAAQRKLNILKLQKAFDASKPNSKPTEVQMSALQDIATVRHRYILGGNQSGKTQTGARECAWVFTETHPFWERPNSRYCGACKSEHLKLVDSDTETYECQDCSHVWVDWGTEPLTMIIIARLSEHYTDIWEKKVRPFLSPGDYKEDKNGGVLQRVVNPKNGNKILFFSHHSPEEAREKVQYFVANWVWLDEMPKSFKLLEELHRRCQSRNAPFLATFTPKLKERRIKKIVETESPIRRKYVLKTLENPINKHPTKRQQILDEHSGLPEEMLKTLLDGEWAGSEFSVYDFQPETHIKKPAGYSPGWRHLEFIDPAASGKAGFGMLAEDPATNVWSLVHAEYLQGAAASDLLDLIETKTAGFNVVKRVSDPHEAWFIKEADKRKRRYVGVFKKNERKKELIKNLQEALNSGRLRIAPWCEKAIDEFSTCEWHETVDGKIVGASRFHILDGLQYAVDNLPKPSTAIVPKSHDEALKLAHRERKKREAQRAKFGNFKPRGRLYTSRGRKVKLS